MSLKTDGKKRVRRDKQESRDQILDKTLALIAKRGWEASTFAAIAKASKMSPANIAYHFESREVLLGALLERMGKVNIEMVEKSMKPEFNAFQRLLAHVQKNIEWAIENPEGAMVLIHIYGTACHDSFFSARYAAVVDRAHLRIKEHLLAGEREGIFVLGSRADTLSRAIHDLIVGAFIKVTAYRLDRQIRYTSPDWNFILGTLLQVET